jgi:hypothetical protein
MAVENPGRRPRVVSAASVNCDGALALVLLQEALADADRSGRDLDQLVVLDELQRLLQA